MNLVKRSVKFMLHTATVSSLLLVSTLLVSTLLTKESIAEEPSKNPAEESKLSFSSTEIAPGLYMLMGVGGFTGGNIGLSVGSDGVVMIDDSMPPFLDIMKQAIATITDKPVDFLINTHVHGDHIGNNAAMGENGTWIVAHKNLRTHLLETSKGKAPTDKAALPIITFTESMDFHLNGLDAHIFHVENAHTNGDVIIHYTSANAIHMGDTLFNGMFPYIDIDKGGSVDGYIAAQQKVLALVNLKTKIIPGHGLLASKQDLQASNDMIVEVRDIIASLISQGKTEDEVVKLEPLAKYHNDWSWSFITTERMTRQVYKSLSTK